MSNKRIHKSKGPYSDLAAGVQPAIDDLLQISLEPLTKVLEHRGTAGEDDILYLLVRYTNVYHGKTVTLYRPRLTSMGDC